MRTSGVFWGAALILFTGLGSACQLVAGLLSDPQPYATDGGAGGQGGAAQKCVSPTDCPGEDNVCGRRTCDNGVCGFKILFKNMPVPSQTYGDCKIVKCDDNGKVVIENDDADIYNDGNPCTTDTCYQGMPLNTLAITGTQCTDPDHPQLVVCDANARCVQCIDNKGCMADPAAPMCLQGKCVPTTCNNMLKDGTETSTDCGGACLPCADNLACKIPNDCLSQVCMGSPGNKICAIPACGDNVKNGKETDIDCGGKDCIPLGGYCDMGQHCKLPSDCVSNVCKVGVCQPPTCTDAVKNGDEAGIDCGGSCPTPCPT